MLASPLRSYLRQRALLCALVLFALHSQVNAQTLRTEAQARAVAARFAPVFYQGLGDEPRHDYITNFDFDGDWRGDNNWAHVDDARFPLKAYIYYAVSETATHYFIHYAVFHPRDYKGGALRGRLLSNVLNETVKRSGKYDPTGLAGEATVAHENDMEGCLVVVAKQGNDLARARVVYVETLAHNHFHKYMPTAPEGDANIVSLEEQHPQLYVEPKGHGIETYQATAKQREHKRLLRYTYDGRADTPALNAEVVRYDLLPLLTTLWPRAQRGVGETYGLTTNYGRVPITVVRPGGKMQQRQVQLGNVGAAFLGRVGGHNIARPPWGWFDVKERNAPAGAWFFDPARTVKRHFKPGDDFSVAYLWQPFLGVGATR